jgi:hypothetical protein
MSNLAEILRPSQQEAVINDSNMSRSIGKISAALSKAQSELESSKKDNSGYGYNYSDLATVIATAKPVLAKNGLAITQLIGQTTNTVQVTTILVHAESGEYFKSIASLPVIEMKGCNVAQGAGAACSYLRRYAYQAILGMASEDNDASSEGIQKPASKFAAPVKPAAPAPEAKKSTTFKRVAPTASPAQATTGGNDDL